MLFAHSIYRQRANGMVKRPLLSVLLWVMLFLLVGVTI